MAYKGLDVSEHKVFTDANYKSFASQISWVIVREGYGIGNLDKQVVNQIAGFKKYKVPIIGAYHFIYAINEDEARRNAETCIQNVKKLGLPDGIRIWCDFEYHTVTKAAQRGVNLGPLQCKQFTRIFCDTVRKAGYRTGIYTNGDFYKNWYGADFMRNYDLWLADYTGGPDYDCVIQQYGELYLNGYSGKLDLNWLYDKSELDWAVHAENVGGEKMTKTEAINKVISIAEAEVGYREKASNAYLDNKTANAGSGNYTKYGRDMHNLQPSNMDFPAAWCDAFVDWCFYKAFGTVMAKQVLCGTFDDYTVNSANFYKKAGRWYSYGQRGDQIFFRNSGGICHTGLVYKVGDGKVYTIEGNKSNMVCYCEYRANDSYIAGYGRPRYELVVTEDELTDGTTTHKTIEQLAKEVIAGQWGNGDERKHRLTQAGYSYEAIQAKVNDLLSGGNTVAPPKKTVTELAKEVIAGKWGNGEDRKKRLKAAGYNYDEVQKKVNELLR